MRGAWVDASDADSIAANLVREHRGTHVMNAGRPTLRDADLQWRATHPVPTYLDMAMSLSHRHTEEPYEKLGVKLGDEQFAVADEWETAGRLALVGMGVEPGPVRRLRPLRRRSPVLRDRRARHPRRLKPRRRGLRLRAVVLDLDHDRGVPEPAGDLGGRPRVVRHPAIQRARGIRLPGWDWPGGVRQRRARRSAAHAALGRRPSASRSSTVSAPSSSTCSRR